ncbi:TIGR03084 family metal-binding protein [Micromonospora sp. RB23]
MAEQQDVIAALAADGDEIDQLVADLSDEQWQLATPAVGWTITHQMAHLTATFHLAGLAAANPDGFTAMAGGLGPDFNANVVAAMAPHLHDTPAELLVKWRRQRAETEHALAAVPAGQLVPWLVRPLPAPVLAAAGMMELFGHGQDIADTLGVRRTRTDRLRHLVEFAVRTWDFGYHARKLTPPDTTFHFDIVAPSGTRWQFGPPDAPNSVRGPAEDLCLLVTRRRHRDDLGLRAIGPEADRWLDLAQAYRGPAGTGRTPGQFAVSAA